MNVSQGRCLHPDDCRSLAASLGGGIACLVLLLAWLTAKLSDWSALKDEVEEVAEEERRATGNIIKFVNATK